MPLSRWPVLQNVVVNLDDGRAIEGLLLKRAGPLLVLVSATLHAPGLQPQAMDGSVYIERDNVAFIQAAPAKGGG